MESPEFLQSLDHQIPLRPKFSIRHEGYAMLEISQDRQVMSVPMAEILNFARRWEADLKARRLAHIWSGRLSLFPYSLLNTRLTDPDCIDVRWDCATEENGNGDENAN